MTPVAGSFLCTLLIRTNTLWVPEEPQVGKGVGVWGATWPVQSAQDEEIGFWFQVCRQSPMRLSTAHYGLPFSRQSSPISTKWRLDS